jgi:predicted secreted acid phosphatase
VGRFRYSYSVSGRSAEELSGTIGRMAKLGYDAVELRESYLWQKQERSGSSSRERV